MSAKQKFLAEILGDEKAEMFLELTGQKQEELREAEVDEKESEIPETEEKEEVSEEQELTEKEEILADLAQIVTKQVIEQIGIKDLSEWVKNADADLKAFKELLPAIADGIKRLSKERDEEIADLIEAPIQKELSWLELRPTQSEDNLRTGKDNDEHKDLQKGPKGLDGIPEDEDYWFAHATGIAPVIPAKQS